jgi:hypothetical protein
MERPEERPAGRRLLELSHQIRHGMITYPGLPAPELSDYLPREASPARYGPGTEFHIGRISMVATPAPTLTARSTLSPGGPTWPACPSTASPTWTAW